MNNLKSLNFSKVFHKVELSPKEILDNELLHTSNSSMTLKCMYIKRVEQNQLKNYYVYFYILQNSRSLHLTFKKDMLPVFNF